MSPQGQLLEAMAARYGVRPSDVLGLDGRDGYCVDEALHLRWLQTLRESRRNG